MKPSNLLIAACLALFTLVTSCKKENSTIKDPESEIEATFELTADNATADFMTEDDNDLLMEAAEDKSLLGNFAPQIESHNFLACAAVAVTPQSGFPKTIVIVFDSNCVSPRGIVRKGTIRIVISDSLRRSGSTAVMTFENYFVNNFKREGTHTWKNTSQEGGKSWQRKVEGGKITAPNGRFWLHASVKDVVQTGGASTRTLFDDVISVTGNASVTNTRGVSRTATITEALQKKYTCYNIDKGRIKFQGPNHFAILDYGNGDCDRVATISIDGRPPRAIVL
ncbi:MAG: hypothetical protein H7X88_04100 [Gloeobacteraceae cyanobacterium ES-bin-316]|nr:hypothetical protein [Ferruginibacter sp.]